jgi:hypothetical protein
MGSLIKSKKIKILLFLFIFLILVLGVMNSCLLAKNSTYRKHNRELIIENDSILSININLKEEIKNFKRSAYSPKNGD